MPAAESQRQVITLVVIAGTCVIALIPLKFLPFPVRAATLAVWALPCLLMQ